MWCVVCLYGYGCIGMSYVCEGGNYSVYVDVFVCYVWCGIWGYGYVCGCGVFICVSPGVGRCMCTCEIVWNLGVDIGCLLQ